MHRSWLLAPLLLASLPAAASPLNPWGPHVGKGVFAMTPFLYVDQTPDFYPYFYGQYGITDSLEILAGVGATIGSASTFDTIELEPRYFFTDSIGVGLHVTKNTWSGGGTDIAPEFIGAWELGSAFLTVNAGWAPNLSSAGFSNGSVYALVAPEYYFTDSTSVFLEIDPTYDINDYGGAEADRFYMELVPGVGTGINDTHWFAFGVALPFYPEFVAGDAYFGMWYSIAFGGED